MTYEPVWKSSSQTWSRLNDAARQNRLAPTRAEALLWDQLRGRRLEGLKFRRQHAIGPYIVDFYCAAANLVVEVDSPTHDHQTDQDAERTRFLEMTGLRIIRFTNEQVVANPGDVMGALKASCQPSPLQPRDAALSVETQG
jgi:5-methyltetrahydrofolate--homocysteine methyltransferase